MIREENIVKYIILVSIVYGVSNFLGEFGSFLSPFIFNYAIVAIVSFYFVIRNYNKPDFLLLLLYSITYAIASFDSGQFQYLVNLFGSKSFVFELSEASKVMLTITNWLVIITSIIKAWISKSVSQNLKSGIINILLFSAFILSIISHQSFSIYLYLIFSFSFSIQMVSSEKISEGLKRIGYLILLNASLETLKILSLHFAV